MPTYGNNGTSKKDKYLKKNTHKHTNNMNTTDNTQFTINFTDLLILAQAVIPPQPIARSQCFEDISERHYHKMRHEESVKMLEYVQKCDGFTLDNEQCRHFYARFNHKNQYFVTCLYDGVEQTIQCYLYDEQYRVSRHTFVDMEQIIKAERIHDGRVFLDKRRQK